MEETKEVLLYKAFDKRRREYEGAGYLVISQTKPSTNEYCFAALDESGLYNSDLSILYEYGYPEEEGGMPCFRCRSTKDGVPCAWGSWQKL